MARRHRRRGVLRDSARHSPPEARNFRALAPAAAHRPHRSPRRDRRRRRLRDPRLPLSAQRGRGDRCRSMRRSPPTSSTTSGPREFMPRQETIYRARFTATTCVRDSPRRAPARPRASTACTTAQARWQLRRRSDGRWLLWLDDGSALPADDVVLALGNPPPATSARTCAPGAHRSLRARPVEHRRSCEPGRRQRVARGQRSHDGRRGAAPRRAAPTRTRHPRAVATWMAAGVAGFRADAGNQARGFRRARCGTRLDASAGAGISHIDRRGWRRRR